MKQERPEPKHPMGVVARRTGLHADVIRAWERRHRAIEPTRTPGNRRLYTDEDIERLLLIRRAVESGWPIGQVGSLDNESIRELFEDTPDAGPAAPLPAVPVRDHVQKAMERVMVLDAEGLEQQLEAASVDLSRVELLEQLLVPLMQEIGKRCQLGTMRTAHEHLASAVTRTMLGSMRAAYPAPETAPGIVVTTPRFQNHELGAMLVAATARGQGWRTLYLGPNLPAEEIALAVRQQNAKVLALSITFPADDPELGAELRRLGRLLPEGVVVLAGGRSAYGYSDALDDIQANRLTDLESLRQFLGEARRRPTATN